MDDLHVVLVWELIEQDHTLVVPHFDLLVWATSCNQAQIVRVGATDDVALVTVSFASLDKLVSRLRVDHLVHVHFDHPVPATRDDCVVITTIADERDLSISWIVALKLKQHNSRLQVIDSEVTLVATYDQLAMILVEDHLSNV